MGFKWSILKIIIIFSKRFCERQVSIDNHLSFMFLFSPKNIHLLFIEIFLQKDIQHTWKNSSISTREITTKFHITETCF